MRSAPRLCDEIDFQEGEEESANECTGTAMANGRGVARCDFKLVHRGGAGGSEPVPYLCMSRTELVSAEAPVFLRYSMP